ncbi:MAG: TonB-dependent receptor plug domain-containing protein [Bacteroidales bacterium]|nr:TonB-dependent receptor plug domain-containing protein [Bacteroidales bacterium]
MKKRSILFLGLILFFASTQAQTRVVYGKITAFNKYPLQNIEVNTKKSKASVKSDSLGMFSIVSMEEDRVIIKTKAFKTVIRKVEADTDTLFVNLVFIDTKSNRELATGYGYINSQDLNYAVNNLEQENNEFCNYTNVFDLLVGRFPGVLVQRTATGGAVYIRGGTSVNMSNEALYVVDGGVTTNISYIHPCDIRSINVLKDASASIYGTRGSNGVVVIETKMGNN